MKKRLLDLTASQGGFREQVRARLFRNVGGFSKVPTFLNSCVKGSHPRPPGAGSRCGSSALLPGWPVSPQSAAQEDGPTELGEGAPNH